MDADVFADGKLVVAERLGGDGFAEGRLVAAAERLGGDGFAEGRLVAAAERLGGDGFAEGRLVAAAERLGGVGFAEGRLVAAAERLLGISDFSGGSRILVSERSSGIVIGALVDFVFSAIGGFRALA